MKKMKINQEKHRPHSKYFRTKVLSSGLETKPGNSGRTKRTLSESQELEESIQSQGEHGLDFPGVSFLGRAFEQVPSMPPEFLH